MHSEGFEAAQGSSEAVGAIEERISRGSPKSILLALVYKDDRARAERALGQIVDHLTVMEDRGRLAAQIEKRICV
jgi:hypothetical protein